MTQHTADQRTMHAIAAALAAGYRMVEEAARQGAVPLECHHLGRAHILAQTSLGGHCVSHWTLSPSDHTGRTACRLGMAAKSQFQLFSAPCTRGRFQEVAGRNRTSDMGSFPERLLSAPEE